MVEKVHETLKHLGKLPETVEPDWLENLLEEEKGSGFLYPCKITGKD
jgi:2'-5' RNA ligase